MFKKRKNKVSIRLPREKNKKKVMNEKSRSSHQKVFWENRFYKHFVQFAGKCLFI